MSPPSVCLLALLPASEAQRMMRSVNNAGGDIAAEYGKPAPRSVPPHVSVHREDDPQRGTFR